MTTTPSTTPSPDWPAGRRPVHAAGSQGLQVGDGNVQHNYFTGRGQVDWPVRVGVVPPLADQRLHRSVDRELTEALDMAAGIGPSVAVLSGLGGVGKTQLAANLAERWWDEQAVDLLVWIAAASRLAVVTGYAQAAAAATGIDDADPQQAAQRLLSWLASTGHRWLVVLDDLIDPQDLTGLWPPSTESGRTVVTTRRRDTGLLAGRRLIDVDVFTAEQAVAYLRAKLVAQPHRLDQAGELAADLGYLPLALAQAAAYILDHGTRMTCAVHRRRLVDQRRQLAELAPHALPDSHQATVAATWGLSIDRADQLTPVGVARPMLELAALLDPNAIPTTLFGTQAVTGYCTTRIGRRVDTDDMDDAAHLLHRFSLLAIDETADTIRIHALVQRAIRDATHPDHRAGLARATADAILACWPGVERDAGHAQLLRANTAALHAAAGLHLWSTDEGAHPVLFRAGQSFGEVGLVAAAADHFDGLCAEAGQWLGPDHPGTLTARHDAAYWRGRAGEPAVAAGAYAVLLEDQIRTLGEGHSQTLSTRGRLAHMRGQAGDAAGAVAAFREQLTQSLNVLGPDHPDTLTARFELAWWTGYAGDSVGAVVALRELLQERLTVLDADHPDILKLRHAVARWTGEAESAAAAATASADVLADRIRVLGPDHPDTFITRANVANWLGRAGDAEAAAAGFAELVADRLRVLGPNHPDTLAARRELAHWRRQAGDSGGAADEIKQVLADCTRVLGPGHTHTLAARNNMASWLGEAGDPAGAAAAFEQLLTDQLRALGPDHPSILTTRINLAYWLAEADGTPGLP